MFAEARGRLFPASRATWIQCCGAYAVFDGVESPVTQCFGLGVTGELTPDVLGTVERFFQERGAAVDLEVSPFAGVSAIGLLCERGYRPVEISSVLYRPLADQDTEVPLAQGDGIRVRAVGPEERELWTSLSVRGWTHQNPELLGFFQDTGNLFFSRAGSVCFVAELRGQAGAAGALSIHEGVALLGGSTTVPELRRRGLQGALLAQRLRYAREHGCDVAMMVAEPGSNSQRNAERKGFRIAYTRSKWRLPAAAAHT